MPNIFFTSVKLISKWVVVLVMVGFIFFVFTGYPENPSTALNQSDCLIGDETGSGVVIFTGVDRTGGSFINTSAEITAPAIDDTLNTMLNNPSWNYLGDLIIAPTNPIDGSFYFNSSKNAWVVQMTTVFDLIAQTSTDTLIIYADSSGILLPKGE